MNTVTDAIDQLKALKLSEYPVAEIKELFRGFGRAGAISLSLHKGAKVVRARLNLGESFKTISELSYKPAECNREYQRASTPLMTMFYGSVGHDVEASCATAAKEIISYMLKSGIENREETITFSLWEVTKEIPLVAIVHNEEFIQQSSVTNELNIGYHEFINSDQSINIENSNIVTEYVANEFAKSNINNDYDYLISALYTNMVIDMRYAGVFYPSVPAAGNGLNVAIHPYFVDNYMVPVRVGERVFSKKGSDCILQNSHAIAEVKPNQKEIHFKPVNNSY